MAALPLASYRGLADESGQSKPFLSPSDNATTSEILVDTLIAWDVPVVFGIVGDGIAPLIEALRRRKEQIQYVGVRHEEAAAFMASGYAKLTGRLGVCVGTTGPGAIHLLNGLYDAALDGAPIVAITGTTFHDLSGTRFSQAVNTTALMQDMALYNIQVTGPRHALLVANRACRIALGNRGVAHLAVAKDIQAMKLSADPMSMENKDARTSLAWTPSEDAPASDQLQRAAEILNIGKRIAILVGQGANRARNEVEKLADLLGAPAAKALLGRAVLADDSPFTTGGIGHLGTAPSSWIMEQCDTLLILGSTMPWLDFYPRPGQARGIQVDINPDRIGLRYPVELGLVGDVRATVQRLLPLIEMHGDRSFLTEAQTRMRDWNALLERIENSPRSPLRPQSVVRAFSDHLKENAIITFDCGANTHFAARHLRLRSGQRLVSPGMLDTMAPGLPYAIAAQFAYPDRQVAAIVGDGGFAMLMAELTTAVQHQLPVKILILNNSSLANVIFEQRQAGYGVYGCDLSPINFAAFANACGADGFRCTEPGEVNAAIVAGLRSPKPAIIEAIVDREEEPKKPLELKG